MPREDNSNKTTRKDEKILYLLPSNRNFSDLGLKSETFKITSRMSRNSAKFCAVDIKSSLIHRPIACNGVAPRGPSTSLGGVAHIPAICIKFDIIEKAIVKLRSIPVLLAPHALF